MSKIGKKPILIPEGVKVEIQGEEIKVSGPKGELVKKMPPIFDIKIDNQVLTIQPKEAYKKNSSHLWGLWRTLIFNMIEGVKNGFSKELEVVGIGWRASLEGGKLILNVGFSHPVVITPPPSITFEVSKNIIKVSGIDKELVGQVAANIRSIRKIDPYKGKGIRYKGEIIRRKAGKAGKVGK